VAQGPRATRELITGTMWGHRPNVPV